MVQIDRHQHERNLLKILEVARQLAAPRGLMELLQDVAEAGRQVLGADRGNVLLYDSASRQLYSTNPQDPFRFSVEVGITGDAARRERTIYVEDCYADERFYRGVDQQTGYQTRTLLAVPLFGLDQELVGVMTLLNPVEGERRWDHSAIELAEVLASQAAVAIQRAMLIEDRMRSQCMQTELNLARRMIEHVIPRQLPELAGYELAAWSRPVDQTGGDIYDVIALPNGSPGLLLLLADATGHGFGPAVSITQFRAMVRIAMRFDATLAGMIRHVNAQVSDDLVEGRFITAFLGQLDPQTHTIDYHAMGQGPLLVFDADENTCRALEATSFPLGIGPTDESPQSDQIFLNPGDMLVILSDGFFEAGQSEGEGFGMHRVKRIIEQHAASTPRTVVDQLISAVDQFTNGRQTDDMTGLAVKRTTHT